MSGCHPELDDVADVAVDVVVVVVLVVEGLSTRAYQYQIATARMMMTRQPTLFRQPFMEYWREDVGGDYSLRWSQAKGGPTPTAAGYSLPGPPRRPPSPPSSRRSPGDLMASGTFAHCAGVRITFESLIACVASFLAAAIVG